jgi:hypothetical protein
VPLAENADRSFVGTYVLGMGFTLTPAERDALIAKDPRNAERIFPYLGGEEVNTSPTQSFDRYVIGFGQMSLEEAEGWPDLIEIVREKVKPERERQKDAFGKRLWWQFLRTRPELYSAIAPLRRCLVTARVTKHLCFSFQPTDRVLNEKLYVFPFDDHARFAVLQSRVHIPWAWLLSSTMKSDLNYSASDCFETFPFPPPAALARLESPGRALYEARAAYMTAENAGLTITCNRMKDPAVTDAAVEQLRALTLAMDRAVLAAYGWDDLAPPPFTTPATDAEKRAVAGFEDAVIDRLFALNAERARAQGTAGGGTRDEASPVRARSAKAGRGKRKPSV